MMPTSTELEDMARAESKGDYADRGNQASPRCRFVIKAIASFA